MRRSTRRLVMLIVSLPLVVLATAWIYQLGMSHLEGQPRDFNTCLEWAAETITTTGYGRDAEWSHPLMTLLVIAVQFTGVFLIFLIFPVFLIPYLEERFEGRLPTALPKLAGHIVIYRYGAAVESLVRQLEHDKVPFVIFEEDENVARRLHERGRKVVYGKLADDDADLSGLRDARGLIANGDDFDNAVITLSARNQHFTGQIICMVAHPKRREPMLRAGADAVFTPLHVLAAAVAAKASTKISPRVSGAQILGRDLEISEVRIHPTSSLAGRSLIEGQVRVKTGATVIGEWIDGELVAQPDPHAPLAIGSILIAAGSHESIVKLGQLATPVANEGPFVIIGFGKVGAKVRQLLLDAGEEVVVIAGEALHGVDFVGDPLDQDLLEKVGLERARAVILTLEDDSATLFAAAVARAMAPEAAIIAAVRRADNVARIHRAGADFALSVGQVAGQLLAFQLLGEESVSIQPQIKVARTAAGELAEVSLMSSRIRERTGCSVIAVERGDELIVEFGEEFIVAVNDIVYITGTTDAVGEYYELFPATRSQPSPAARAKSEAL